MSGSAATSRKSPRKPATRFRSTRAGVAEGAEGVEGVEWEGEGVKHEEEGTLEWRVDDLISREVL